MAKTKVNPYATQINAAKSTAAEGLTQYVHNLRLLADGGYVEEEFEYQPAGLVLIDEQVDDIGDPLSGPLGINTRHQRRPRKVLAFPDLPAEQMVLVKKKVRTLAPDRAANIYLVDRILGRPEQTSNVNTGDTQPDAQPVNIGVDELRDLWTSSA